MKKDNNDLYNRVAELIEIDESHQKLIEAMIRISKAGWNGDTVFEEAIEEMHECGWELISTFSGDRYFTCVFRKR